CTEWLRYGIDEANAASSVSELVVAGWLAGIDIRAAEQGAKPLSEQRPELFAADHPRLGPLAVAVERHELDEAKGACLLPREIDQIVNVGQVHIPQHQRVQLELQLGKSLSGCDAGEHARQPVATSESLKRG